MIMKKDRPDATRPDHHAFQLHIDKKLKGVLQPKFHQTLEKLFQFYHPADEIGVVTFLWSFVCLFAFSFFWGGLGTI